MSKRIFAYATMLIVFVHGLIHNMGLYVYWPVGELADLPYKTTLLSGELDVGVWGIRIFGIFWAVAAIGLVAAAVAMLLQSDWWMPLLLVSTLLSLILCLLDYTVAWTGAALDVALLAVIALVPQFTEIIETSTA